MTTLHNDGLIYEITGATDAVTDCTQCDRDDLKGTLRLRSFDDEGEITEPIHMCAPCAAKITRQSIADARAEAIHAARRRYAQWVRDTVEWNNARRATSDQYAEDRGLPMTRQTYKEWQASDSGRVFDATYLRPQTPEICTLPKEYLG